MLSWGLGSGLLHNICKAFYDFFSFFQYFYHKQSIQGSWNLTVSLQFYFLGWHGPGVPGAHQSMWGGHRSRWRGSDHGATALGSLPRCILVRQTDSQCRLLTLNDDVKTTKTWCARYSPCVEKFKNTQLGFWVSCHAATYQVYIRIICLCQNVQFYKNAEVQVMVDLWN